MNLLLDEELSTSRSRKDNDMRNTSSRVYLRGTIATAVLAGLSGVYAFVLRSVEFVFIVSVIASILFLIIFTLLLVLYLSSKKNK